MARRWTTTKIIKTITPPKLLGWSSEHYNKNNNKGYIMRIFFASEKPLLDESKFFQKRLSKHFGSKINLNDVQNCLARSYGWTNFNQFSINHKKVNTKALAQTDCLLDSLSIEEIEVLQKRKYTYIFTLVDAKLMSQGYLDDRFKKFVEDVEYRRLGFINLLLNKKQDFVFEPEKFLAQPTTILAFNSYYEGGLDRMLDVHSVIAAQAYEACDGSIWINSTTPQSLIFEKLDEVSDLNIEMSTIRKDFKLHCDYMDYDKAIQYALNTRANFWSGRTLAYINLIRYLAKDKLKSIKNRQEFFEVISLDYFFNLVKDNASKLSQKQSELVENLFFMKVDKLLLLDEIDPIIYEQWGYCIMTITSALENYDDLFAINGLRKDDLFKVGQHNVITCLHRIDKSVVTDLLREHLLEEMESNSNVLSKLNPEHERKSMVVNIDQDYAHQDIGYSALAAQSRPLGYKFNFFINNSDAQQQVAPEISACELASIKANTKVHVTLMGGVLRVESPFYTAFQDNNYIEVNI